MRIAFLFYDDMTTLDAIGPWEVLARLPGAEAVAASRSGGAIRTDTGLVFAQTAKFSDIAAADVLVVPGTGNFAQLAEPAAIEWARSLHATTQWTTSVCTGAMILGAAGILQGKRATTHWAAAGALTKHGATYAPERVVIEGKVITAAGVSSGIDMALTLAARLVDEPTARALQLGIEYDPQPPFDSGNAAKADDALKAKALSVLAGGVKR